MLPQKPPQPSCSYFPLKLLSAGIQTSKLMTESLVGVAVPATRQNCGSPVFVVQPVLPVAQPGGVLKVPPVMVCAAVTCPCGRDRFINPSQVVAAETALAQRKMAPSDTVITKIDLALFFTSFLPHYRCSGIVVSDAGRDVCASWHSPYRMRWFGQAGSTSASRGIQALTKTRTIVNVSPLRAQGINPAGLSWWRRRTAGMGRGSR